MSSEDEWSEGEKDAPSDDDEEMFDDLDEFDPETPAVVQSTSSHTHTSGKSQHGSSRAKKPAEHPFSSAPAAAVAAAGQSAKQPLSTNKKPAARKEAPSDEGAPDNKRRKQTKETVRPSQELVIQKEQQPPHSIAPKQHKELVSSDAPHAATSAHAKSVAAAKHTSASQPSVLLQAPKPIELFPKQDEVYNIDGRVYKVRTGFQTPVVMTEDEPVKIPCKTSRGQAVDVTATLVDGKITYSAEPLPAKSRQPAAEKDKPETSTAVRSRAKKPSGDLSNLIAFMREAGIKTIELFDERPEEHKDQSAAAAAAEISVDLTKI